MERERVRVGLEKGKERGRRWEGRNGEREREGDRREGEGVRGEREREGGRRQEGRNKEREGRGERGFQNIGVTSE